MEGIQRKSQVFAAKAPSVLKVYATERATLEPYIETIHSLHLPKPASSVHACVCLTAQRPPHGWSTSHVSR